MSKYQADIQLPQGHIFRSILEGDKIPEICGWVEKDHSIVPGTYGFYRTTDPEAAARIAASNLGLEA